MATISIQRILQSSGEAVTCMLREHFPPVKAPMMSDAVASGKGYN